MIYGVNLEILTHFDRLLGVLRDLPRRPTVRLQIEDFTKPKDYDLKVRRLYAVADIMAVALTPRALERMTIGEIRSRTETFSSALRGHVAFWELARDVEPGSDLEEKLLFARDAIRWGKTVVTYRHSDNWVGADLRNLGKLQTHYVLISHSPDDSRYDSPLGPMLNAVANACPNSLIGIGGFRPKVRANQEQRAEMCHRYYGMEFRHPRFIGGGFYADFHRDCVRNLKNKFVLNAIKEAWIGKAKKETAVVPKPGGGPQVHGGTHHG